jgi:hypothetical protein
MTAKFLAVVNSPTVYMVSMISEGLIFPMKTKSPVGKIVYGKYEKTHFHCSPMVIRYASEKLLTEKKFVIEYSVTCLFKALV